MKTLLLMAAITIITLMTTLYSIPNIQGSYPFNEEEEPVVDSMINTLMYSEKLKYFVYQCAWEVGNEQNRSGVALNDCLVVMNDLNTHYDQLWEKHVLTIDTYATFFSDNCLNNPTFTETYPEDCARVLNATTPS
jgi:hypothetical protein